MSLGVVFLIPQTLAFIRQCLVTSFVSGLERGDPEGTIFAHCAIVSPSIDKKYFFLFPSETLDTVGDKLLKNTLLVCER